MFIKNQASFIIVTAIVVSFNFFRLHFGLGGADEAYYYLTAYRLSTGSRLLVDIWEHQFSALFTAPLVYAFHIVSGSLDGVILFLREVYLLFTIILLVSLRKRLELLTSNSSSWYLTILMLLFCPWSLATFSYNTLSLLFLYASFIFSASKLIAQQQLDSRFSFLISGIYAGLAVIAYPVYVVVAIFYIFSIYFTCSVFHSDRGIRSALEYFLGLSFVGLVMISYLALNIGGIETLWGRLSLLFGNYSGIPMGRGIVKIGGYWAIIIDVVIYVSATLFSFAVISYLVKERQIEFARNSKFILAGICGDSLMLMGISIEFSKDFLLLNKICLTIFFLILFIFWFTQKKRWDLVLLFLGPSVLTLLLTLLGSWMQADWRTYILFIALPVLFILLKDFSLVPVLGNYIEKGKKMFSFILVSSLLVSNYSYVYAEKTIYNLTSQITFGPYKGIYVSEGTFDEVVYLNEALSKWVRPEDFIATWSVSPLAYVLSPGKICAPSVWWALSSQANLEGTIRMPFNLESRCHVTKIVEIRSLDSRQGNPTSNLSQFNEVFSKNHINRQIKIYDRFESIN